MNARDVVRGAALLAARHAWPELPPSLVRWSDEPRSQGESDYPHVTLGEVSSVPEGPVSIRRSASPDGSLAVRMLQTYIWTVQVKCEGWKLDSVADNNPIYFTRRMRFGWYLQAVTAALLDPGSPEPERNPVKMVDEVGQVLSMNQRVRGHTLPVLVFDIEFRVVDHDGDPTPVDVIETAVTTGRIQIRRSAGSDSPPAGWGVDIIITTES